MQQSNKVKLTIAAGAFLFLLLIGYSVFTLASRVGKVGTTITVYPQDATVTVDGNKTTDFNPYLTPGQHTFKASKVGFSDVSQTLTVSDQANTVILLPIPVSADAIAWAQQPQVSMQRETLGGQQANLRGAYLAATYPLMSKLPYIDIAGPFAIDYGYTGPDNSQLYFLIHDSTPDGRQAAFRWIRAHGIDPATLDIRYDEYTNPLTKGSAS